jgi:phage major head subunit gpT-like protein
MQITPQILISLSQGFNAAFMQGFGSVAPTYTQIAMLIPSSSNAENYGWLKDLPGMREWVGQRVILNLETTAAQLVNKPWEHTIGVRRTDIEDDRLGIYTAILQQQGEIAARHPDDLVWSLLAGGFTTKGFDGQPFFDADHLGYDAKGKEASWSNVQAGNGAPWFLADLTRNFMKPLIFQNRQAARFIHKTDPKDDNVFLNDTFIYGVDARYTAGFGFHQLVVGSKDELNSENYQAARLALMGQHRPDGSPLPIKPTHLIIGGSNEAAALKLLNAELIDGGDSNIWRGTAALMISPYLQ